MTEAPDKPASPWALFLILGAAGLVVLTILGAGTVAFLMHRSQRRAHEQVIVAPPRRPPPEPEIEKPTLHAEKFLDIEKQVEDPIFKRADHNESADTEEYQSMKGDNTDFTSDRPLMGEGGGRYGGRFGGKKNLVAKGGGNAETEAAVLAALQWLSRHQNADGSWSLEEFRARCADAGGCDPTGIHASIDAKKHNYDVGVTGLAVLAFLGAGYTHSSAEFGDVVRGAIQHLLSVQDRDGCIGSRDVEQYMYNHAIAALALSEAYGLTGSNKFKEPAQRAIDFLAAAQNPGKAWRYTYQSGNNDTSVTGWAVMALKSADLSGLTFDRNVAYDGVRAWLDRVSYKVGDRWMTGYLSGADAEVFIPGVNEQFNQHPTMTAIGLTSRIFMDKKRADPKVAGGAAVLLEDRPKHDGNAVDYYYWYHASIALYQFDGPDGPKWKVWNKAMVDALAPHQNAEKETCRRGSWEPVDRWSCMGGRVYATTINALTLETYYRYASVFDGPK